MSAIAVVVEKQRAHLLSDTAATFRGRLMGHCQKCIPMPHLNAAVAVRGTTRIVRLIHHVLSEYEDVDKMKWESPIRLRALTGGIISRLTPAHSAVDLVVAGVKDGQAWSWAWESKSPKTVVDVDYLWAAPGGGIPEDEIERALSGVDADVRGSTRRLDDASIRLLDVLRKHHPGCIGGFAQMATVTSTGIWSRTLKQWPDRLGQRIGL